MVWAGKEQKNNLEETFDAMEHIYNIKDLEQGKLKEILKTNGKRKIRVRNKNCL